MGENLTIGFIGNPNCGKTTLFNAYTGANLKVANWPGVTVEKVEGAIKDHDMNIRLVDLPGTYSLTMLVAYSMYLIGLVVAILVAAVIHLIDRKTSENYLLIELPEYKAPSGRTVAIYVWEKVKDYLTKAGTTIFMASILMWVILNFGPHGYTTEMTESFGAILGHWLVPFFAPIGLGFWQIAVALIAGISAKEVVVSSCAVLFGVPNINSGAGMNTLVGILGAAGFGQLNAFCLMIFCLLYIPCAATLATIRKEAASTRWMLLSALFQLVVAWVITFAVYRIGLLL